MDKKVILLIVQTSDGILTEVEQGVLLKFSKIVNTMIHTCEILDVDGQEDGNQECNLGFEAPIKVPFNKNTFDIIMTWAHHHKSDDPSKLVNIDDIPRAKRAEHMSTWDKSFIEMLSIAELADLLIASDFLDIEALTILICQRVILLTRSKSIEEIREFLQLENDFTKEIKRQIELENFWAVPERKRKRKAS